MSEIDSLDVMKSVSYLISAKFVRSTLSTGINLVLISIIARNLGPTGYGLWALTTMFITFSTTFGMFGITNSVIHYIGQYTAKNEGDTVVSIIIIAYSFIFVLSVIISIFLFLFAGFFAQMLSISQMEPLIKACALIPTVSNLYSLNYVLLQSYNKFSNMSILDIVFSLSLPLLTILCLYTIGMAVVSIVIAQFIVFVLLSISSLILVGKIFPNKMQLLSHLKNRTIFTFLRFEKLWELIVYGFYTLIIGLLGFLDHYVIIFSLSLFSLESVGIFSAAYGFFIFGWALFIPKTLFAVLFPKFSSLAVSDRDKMWNVSVRIFKYSIFFLLFLPLFAVIFSNIFLLIYSDRFIEALPILAILGIGFVLNALIRTYSILFYSLNKVKIWTLLHTTSNILLILSALTLIPLYGLYGAVWSFALKYIYQFVVSFLYVLKVFEFKFDLKIIYVPVFVSFPLIGVLLILNIFISAQIAMALFVPFFLIYIIIVLRMNYFDETDWNIISLIKDIKFLSWTLHIINPLRNFCTRKD